MPNVRAIDLLFGMATWRALFFIILALSATRSWAHPMDLASIDVSRVEDRLRFQFRLHQQAVARILGRSHLEGESLASLAPRLFAATLGSAPAELGDRACEWTRPELEPAQDGTADFVDLEVFAVCSRSPFEPFFLRLRLPFLKDQPPAFQLLLRAQKELPVVLSAPQSEVEIGEALSSGIVGYIRMGLGHIGALPGEWLSLGGGLKLPEGIDHILFLLALIFASRGAGELLKCVTGFTLGHSLTLGLSAFRIVHIHSAWVEVAIAFSIAATAGLSLCRPKVGHHWMVAAFFGVVHGLGFASALQELELSGAETWRALLGFNLGIELGQVAIAILVVPWLYGWVRRTEWLKRAVETSARLGLVSAGGYWFLVRFFYAV